MFDFRPHEVTLIFKGGDGTYDEAGSYTPGASSEEIVDAHVDIVSGNEYDRAQRVAADTNAVIYVDYREDIDETVKVRHGDQLYSISAVISQGGLDETLGLYAKEVR